MMPSPASQPGMPESAQNWATIQRLAQIKEAAQHRPLTEEEQAELDSEAPCNHCGGFHSRACPRVKRIAFRLNGQGVQEVEYFPASEIDWTGVVFEDVGDDEMPGFPLTDVETIITYLRRPSVAGPLEDTRDGKLINQVARRVEVWLESSQAEAVQSVHDPES